MSQIFVVSLRRAETSVPWGFRIEGGVDIGAPLCIMKVVSGSVAYQCGLQSGDRVLQINDSNAERMTHEQAKMEIIRSANDINFTLSRGGPQIVHKVWRPTVVSSTKIIPSIRVPRSPQATNKVSVKSNFSPTQQSHQPHHSINIIPIPYKGTPDPVIVHDQTGRTKRIIHNEHNSPMGLYSDQNVMSAFKKTVDVSNVKPSLSTKTLPTQGTMHCGSCGDMIKGVFVKVHGQIPMHPACLKCCKCGIGLKNVGYFYIDQKLYCETHAKQTSRPAPGMQPVVVYK